MDLNSKEDLRIFLTWIGGTVNYIMEILEENGYISAGTTEGNKEVLKEILAGKIDL